MIDYLKACEAASEYFYDKMNIKGLSKALENPDYWFFCGGVPGRMVIGNLIISVSKENGSVEIVEMPSKANREMLKKAWEIKIPETYIGTCDSGGEEHVR